MSRKESDRRSDNMNLSELGDQDVLSKSVTEAENMTNVTRLCDEYCQENSEN